MKIVIENSISYLHGADDTTTFDITNRLLVVSYNRQPHRYTDPAPSKSGSYYFTWTSWTVSFSSPVLVCCYRGLLGPGSVFGCCFQVTRTVRWQCFGLSFICRSLRIYGLPFEGFVNPRICAVSAGSVEEVWLLPIGLTSLVDSSQWTCLCGGVWTASFSLTWWPSKRVYFHHCLCELLTSSSILQTTLTTASS